jgi:hypothetical protein
MAEPITLVPPTTNNADGWNAAIKDAADKAGIELPKPGEVRITEAPDAAKKEEDTIYRSTLKVGDKEMVFEGKDAAEVLQKYSVAVEAAQLASAQAAAPAPAKVEEKKPVFSEAEMFDIQVGLQKGDPAVLDNYILKSGVLDKYLESKGLKVEDLKAATTKTQSNDLNEKWETATKDFLEKNKEYPGGAQNTYLMGLMLAELGLRNKPSVESFEAAYAKMKERNIVFPAAAAKSAEEIAAEAAAAAAGKKKEATSSTAVGSHGGRQEATPQQGAPTGKVELDTTKLSIREASESWNELIRRGYKPDQIVIKQ